MLIWDQKEQKWSKFSKRIIQQETFIESVNMIQLLITALYYFALMSDKYKYINRDRQSMGTCICIFKSIVFVFSNLLYLYFQIYCICVSLCICITMQVDMNKGAIKRRDCGLGGTDSLTQT